MTTSKTTSRTLRTIAAVAAAALIAAACGGDDTVVPEPAVTTDAATTTQPVVPDTTTSAQESDADADTDATVETDAPSDTATTVVEPEVGESAVAEEEPDEPAGESVSGESGAAPEGTTTPVTTVPSDDAPEPEAEQPEPEAPTTESGTEGTTSPQPEPETETEPEPESWLLHRLRLVQQPEPESVQQPEPESVQQPEGDTAEVIVCVRDADGLLVCPQVVPDDYQCENVADDLLCRPPGTEPGTTPEPGSVEQPEVSTGDDIVCVRQSDGLLSCPEAPPADYWCENVGDTLVCHPPDTKPEPEPEQTPQTGWTPPVAGAVPEVHVDTPLPEWQRGDGAVNPDGRAYDYPRPTQQTVSWADWCSGAFDSCRWLLHEMYQALDYLGADPQCVLNIYTQRVNYYLSQGSGANASYAANTLGWHLCATVIDPIVGDLPIERPDTDVGLRLSDTPGITLADRCRAVLTDPFPDIQLENRHYDINQTTRFGQDCDAWAAWVMEDGLDVSAPACNASASLAEEWMEHTHNQHEHYFRPHC